MNASDSDTISLYMTEAGFPQTTDIKEAGIIILNTCVLKEKTEGKIKRKIQDLKEERKNKGETKEEVAQEETQSESKEPRAKPEPGFENYLR